MVESGERVSGIDLPLNLIEIVMSLLSPLPFSFGSAAPPSSIAVLNLFCLCLTLREYRILSYPRAPRGCTGISLFIFCSLKILFSKIFF